MNYMQELSNLGIIATQNGRYTCPKCSHTRENSTQKCLSVTFNEKIGDSVGVAYHCFHCGFKGFIPFSNNNTFNRYDVNTKPKSFFKPVPDKEIDNKEKLYDYFKKRGISKEIVDKYKVGFDGKKIIFNYYKNNELVNIKYRASKKNEKTGKIEKIMWHVEIPEDQKNLLTRELTFFGMDEVPLDTKEVVITEGCIETLTYAQVGIPAISVPISATDVKLECIENCWDFLQRFDKFIIAPDNDEAGNKLKQNLITRLGTEKCKVVNWEIYKQEEIPFTGKDANELLLHDEFALNDLIYNAKDCPIDGVLSCDTEKEEILEYYETGGGQGYSTGWDSLDECFTIKSKHLMVVTGHPSRGKSLFVDNLLFNLTQQYQQKHLICGFETSFNEHFKEYAQMYKEKRFSAILKPTKLKELGFYVNIKKLFDNLIENGYINENGKILQKLENIESASDFIIDKEFNSIALRLFNEMKMIVSISMTKEDVKDCISYYNNYLYKIDVRKFWTVPEILEVAKVMVRRYGIKNLVIDPYNALNNDFSAYGGREDKYVEAILELVKKFGHEHDVFIIFIAHTPKIKPNKDGELLAPSLYDISGGNAWWTKCDYGITIHRGKDKATQMLTNITNIIIHKIKNQGIGPSVDGGCQLIYDYKTFKLKDNY